MEKKIETLEDAVAALDAQAAQRLIAQGADPFYDLPDAGCMPGGESNYYIQLLSDMAWEQSRGQSTEKPEKIMDLVRVFARAGVEDIYTFCVSIDKAKREISVLDRKEKY